MIQSQPGSATANNAIPDLLRGWGYAPIDYHVDWLYGRGLHVDDVLHENNDSVANVRNHRQRLLHDLWLFHRVLPDHCVALRFAASQLLAPLPDDTIGQTRA